MASQNTFSIPQLEAGLLGTRATTLGFDDQDSMPFARPHVPSNGEQQQKINQYVFNNSNWEGKQKQYDGVVSHPDDVRRESQRLGNLYPAYDLSKGQSSVTRQHEARLANPQYQQDNQHYLDTLSHSSDTYNAYQGWDDMQAGQRRLEAQLLFPINGRTADEQRAVQNHQQYAARPAQPQQALSDEERALAESRRQAGAQLIADRAPKDDAGRQRQLQQSQEFQAQRDADERLFAVVLAREEAAARAEEDAVKERNRIFNESPEGQRRLFGDKDRLRSTVVPGVYLQPGMAGYSPDPETNRILSGQDVQESGPRIRRSSY